MAGLDKYFVVSAKEGQVWRQAPETKALTRENVISERSATLDPLRLRAYRGGWGAEAATAVQSARRAAWRPGKSPAVMPVDGRERGTEAVTEPTVAAALWGPMLARQAPARDYAAWRARQLPCAGPGC
ncbi:MAG: hypothetical protein H5T86_10675 [Armatimonadetes bacterium]|nr:hypothetical protein [Armatimonadota bacterium]